MPGLMGLSDVKRELGQKPLLHEEELPLREFMYQEDGDRHVTLSLGQDNFTVVDPWAQAQLCSLIGYNSRIFRDNDPALNCIIMRECLPRVKSRVHLVKWSEEDGSRSLRGILPRAYTTIRDVELVDLALSTVGSEVKAATASLTGPVTSMKLVQSEQPLEVAGEQVWFGMNLSCSEVGASKLVVDSLLFIPVCSNGLIVKWGDARYFTHNYRDARAEDLRDLYRNSLERFVREKHSVNDILQRAAGSGLSKEGVKTLWNQLVKSKGVSNSFMREIEGEFQMQMGDTDTRSLWDVAQHITKKAQELPAPVRIRHEIFVGEMLGLEMTTPSE
jgi:hypothetical protein